MAMRSQDAVFLSEQCPLTAYRSHRSQGQQEKAMPSKNAVGLMEEKGYLCCAPLPICSKSRSQELKSREEHADSMVMAALWYIFLFLIYLFYLHSSKKKPTKKQTKQNKNWLRKTESCISANLEHNHTSHFCAVKEIISTYSLR